MSGKFYIENYGCQMNAADSETARRFLLGDGLDEVDGPEAADIVVVNTCADPEVVTDVPAREPTAAMRAADIGAPLGMPVIVTALETVTVALEECAPGSSTITSPAAVVAFVIACPMVRSARSGESPSLLSDES